MRNQNKYDEPKRDLNTDEKAIVAEVEGISGLRINATAVQYERHAPRATLCTIYLGRWVGVKQIFGITVRNKTDKENPATGRLQSFRRALDDHVAKVKREARIAAARPIMPCLEE